MTDSSSERIYRLGRRLPISLKRLPVVGAVARRVERDTAGSEATEVAPGLFVGSSLPAREAADQFDVCVSVANGLEYETTDHQFSLSPTDGDTDAEFSAAVEAVADVWGSGKTTLVHCHEGRERAPTVAATVLAQENDWSFSKAIQHVREQRDPTEPTTELRALARGYLNE